MNHAIDTSLLDDSRSFGITYWKESCIDRSCYALSDALKRFSAIRFVRMGSQAELFQGARK